MEIIQTHQENNPAGARGIYFGESPDPDPQVNAFVGNTIENIHARELAFQEYVDSAPNLNDTYLDELTIVHERFAEAGLDIAPVIVLDAEHFAAAMAAAGETTSDFGGGYLFGRSLVCEHPDPNVRDLIGKDLVLGIALHESAHSTARQTEKQIVSSKVKASDGSGKLVLNRTVSTTRNMGFVRPRRKDMSVAEDGNFLEESWADLTRVKQSSEVGRESKVDDGEEVVGMGGTVKYVGEEMDMPLPDENDALITIPARFAQCTAKVAGHDGSVLMDSPNGIAAYGLDLLDNAVPGLYDAMKSSRKDPARQREVISMINSVKPGLYRELRMLPYGPDGFRQGLLSIGKALKDRIDKSGSTGSNSTDEAHEAEGKLLETAETSAHGLRNQIKVWVMKLSRPFVILARLLLKREDEDLEA